MTPNRRLVSETVSFDLEVGEGRHHLDLSIARDQGGHVRELVFVGRGKIGHGLDAMLRDLGVKISRAIQRRNPMTGDPE